MFGPSCKSATRRIAAIFSSRGVGAIEFTARLVTLGVSTGVLAVALASCGTQERGSSVRVEVVAGSKLEVARSLAVKVSRVPGVVATTIVTRSIALVGPQREDVFGIDVGTAFSAGAVTDRDLIGKSSQAVLRSLKVTLDGVLVPQRTIQDYSLRIGDLLKLRLLSPASPATFYPVPFRVVGTVRSFAGSPRAGAPFLVVNMRYLENVTRSRNYIVLVRVKGDAAAVRARIARAITPDHALLLPPQPRAL